MHIHLAPQSIEALAMVISGGGGNDQTPPIGVYRSAPKLESFMRGCNVAMSVGSGSRLPALVEALERANRIGDQTILKNIVERAADPRDFLSEPDRLQAVLGREPIDPGAGPDADVVIRLLIDKSCPHGKSTDGLASGVMMVTALLARVTAT